MTMLGKAVKLISFKGTLKPGSVCKPSENYWLLIGMTGRVIKGGEKSLEGKVLIKFDQPIESLGLHCHNEMSNSLWLLPSDLEQVN